MAEIAATGSCAGGALPTVWFGDALRAVGRMDEALAYVDRGLGIAREINENIFLAEGYCLKGEILLARGGSEATRAEALLREAIDVARAQQAKLMELRAAIVLARVWRGRGRRAEARDVLLPVYDWFTEGFAERDLRNAKTLLEELG